MISIWRNGYFFLSSFSSHKYIILTRINAQVTSVRRVNRRKPDELTRYGRDYDSTLIRYALWVSNWHV